MSSLTFSEREKLIAHFLSSYSRRLSSEQVAKIAAAPQTGNPLYLTSLLDELRQEAGYSDQLDRAIRHYLTANCVSELFERILERFEKDFGSDLVKRSLSLVWKSPQGLSDEEILGLLRKAGTPVSSTAWKSFEIAARSILLETGERFRICHPAWNTAVRNRYFP